MTTNEAPSGVEDLAAQTDAVEREAAAEDAQARRIADLEAELAAAKRSPSEAGKVINPDGSDAEVEIDKSLYILDEETDEPLEVGGQLLLKSEFPTDEEGRVELGEDGRALRFDQVERDESGEPILDDDGKLIPLWPHDTIEHKGRIIQVRIPSAAAITGFQQVLSPSLSPKTVNRLYDQFVSKHMSPLSRRRIVEEMIDPDGALTAEDWHELWRKLITKGTARPTKRSSR